MRGTRERIKRELPIEHRRPELTYNFTALALVLGSALIGLLARHLLRKRVVPADDAEAEDESRARYIVQSGPAQFLPSWCWRGRLSQADMGVVALPLRPAFQQAASKLLLGGAIVAGTFAAARGTGRLVGSYASRHQRFPGATSIFANIARFAVISIGLLVTFQTLGVSVGPILTALGVGGLAVALAMQDTLANLFAGLHVIGSRKVIPGDYVVLDTGEEGCVEDINWRNTSLRNLRNNMIVVPNARLASAILTNYYQPAAEMALLVPIGVSYDSNLESVEQVTTEVGREVMKEVAGGVVGFDPLVRYHTFDDSSIGFNVILRIKEPPTSTLSGTNS